MSHYGTNAVFVLWTPYGRCALEDLAASGFSAKSGTHAELHQEINGTRHYDILTARLHGQDYLACNDGVEWMERMFERDWGIRSPDSALSLFKRHERSKEPVVLRDGDVDAAFNPLREAGYGMFVIRGHEKVADSKPEALRAQVEMGLFVRSTYQQLNAFALR